MISHQHHRLSRLPLGISRWLGYRPPGSPSPVHGDNSIVWIWSFVGTFLGISVIQAVFGQARYFSEKGVPSLITSYGASAVLIYGVPESPLAQPRSLIFGHFIGALTGLCITKIFQACVLEQEKLDSLLWLAASLSCATSIVVMQVTRTVHPPGGATAVLPALSPDVREIGWYLLPVVLLTSTLAMFVALINDNVQRRYPLFWIYPHRTPSSHVIQPRPHPIPSSSNSEIEVVLEDVMDKDRDAEYGVHKSGREEASSDSVAKLT